MRHVAQASPILPSGHFPVLVWTDAPVRDGITSRPNMSGSPRPFAVALAMGTQYEISVESLRFRSICGFGLSVA
ncbi:hypothetical protein BUPH_08416 (plasmid) [Paraburkholderia phenoliruptrix BR3459a]|uniref:Uncharacterized protein n=1 Tax=Paraburkholderia phenoliruptrix BR3459a TaxID=1229205 RepID=K0E171_9BURK|nr:hypothetical protein BUPH_08416 [Paraburkholderia phenoliruptrix BR3459a]